RLPRCFPTRRSSDLLFLGEPLAQVHEEARQGLAYAQKVRFGLVVDFISTQLALIRTLRGQTPTFGCFDDELFDEARFEAHLDSRSEEHTSELQSREN